MTWQTTPANPLVITLRYGLMLGMGKHCPARKFKRLALIALLLAATLYAAIIAVRSASATVEEHRAVQAQRDEARADRAKLLALLNGASLYEQKPDGTRIYTRARLDETEIKPSIVGLLNDN